MQIARFAAYAHVPANVTPGLRTAFARTLDKDAWMELAVYERRDLEGVVRLCDHEGWSSFGADLERAHRVLTAPGVTAVVARDGSDVVGFAYVQSDGEIQAHLSSIAVDPSCRRQGIARQLLQLAIEQAGGERIDLITETSSGFYVALTHKHWDGFRIYPPFI